MARKRTVLQRSAWLLDTPPIGRRNAAVAGLTSRRPQAPEDLPERVVFGCSRRTRSVRLWVIFPKTKTSYSETGYENPLSHMVPLLECVHQYGWDRAQAVHVGSWNGCGGVSNMRRSISMLTRLSPTCNRGWDAT
jgi:hypothetical protein